MKTTVAILEKSSREAASRATSLLKRLPANNTQFVLATPNKVTIAKDATTLYTERTASQTAIGIASTVRYRQAIPFNTQNAVVAFDGTIYSPSLKIPIKEFIAGRIQDDYYAAIEAFLKNVEGDFFLIVVQERRLLATRDSMGVQPLYFGENEAIAAFASNRKTLWNLGIIDPNPFPPGHMAIVTKEGFKFKPVQTLKFTKPKPISIEEAATRLQKLLKQSVQLRVAGLKSAVVAFSGGLDSSLIAYLAKETGIDVLLLHVSLDGQKETEEARKAAKKLGLPLQVNIFTESDMEKILLKVVELIEDPDPVKVGVGAAFYWNAQKTAEAGYQVMLAGQGADELFGGYKRYIDEYILNGEKAVRKTMFQDVSVIDESNIARDKKICEYHDVELRLPFASFDLAKFAICLPAELKLEKSPDSLRKLVLRKTASNLGLPSEIAMKPKKAMQYSTGINNVIRKLARSKNLTIVEYLNQLFLAAKKEYRYRDFLVEEF